MKYINQKLIVAAFALIIITSLAECKKGEEDPIISFNSRKARLEGDWKVSRFESTGRFSPGGPSTAISNIIERYDGTTWETSLISNGHESASVSLVNYTYSFFSDGTYKMHKDELLTGATTKMILDEEGAWNFLSGVGDTKNKEFISLLRSKQIYTSGTNIQTLTYDTYTGISETWQITSLKNKKMKVNWENSISNPDGFLDENTNQMILSQ